jgi:hypothetical protein
MDTVINLLLDYISILYFNTLLYSILDLLLPYILIPF